MEVHSEFYIFSQKKHKALMMNVSRHTVLSINEFSTLSLSIPNWWKYILLLINMFSTSNSSKAPRYPIANSMWHRKPSYRCLITPLAFLILPPTPSTPKGPSVLLLTPPCFGTWCSVGLKYIPGSSQTCFHTHLPPPPPPPSTIWYKTNLGIPLWTSSI